MSMSEFSEDDDKSETIRNNSGILQAYGNYFRDLCFNRTFSDLTIMCEGQSFSCHKAVLWSQSKVFREILDIERESEEIILTNFSPILLERLLRLLYCGNVLLPNKQAGDFISLLPEWGIESQLEVIPKIEGTTQVKVYKSNDKETSTTTTLENVIMSIEEKHHLDQKVFLRKLFNSGMSISNFCSICLLSFSSTLQYQNHQRRHAYAKDNILIPSKECFLCSAKFYNKETYEEHLLAVDHISSKDVFQPIVCLQVDQSINYLASKLHDDKNYGCSRRGETEVESDSSSPDVSVQCPVCFKDILTPSLLPSHLQLHTSGQKFECCFCFSGFTSKVKLFDHQRIHDNKKPFICLTCKLRFQYSSELTSHFIESRHNKTQSGSPKSLYSSKKGSKNQRKLDNEQEQLLKRLSKKVKPHQESAISPRFRYECPLCSINLGCNKESFSTHIKLHSTDSQNSCKYCFTVTGREEALADHVADVHKDKMYHCPKGDFCADTHSKVLLHFETSNHGSLNNINMQTFEAIQIENKSYGQDKLFQIQVTMENEEKESIQPMEKYSMQKVFKSKDVCPVCYMELEGERSLKNHQKIHVTGFPMECMFCLMGFIEKDKMEKHKILHCNFYECQNCSEEFENYQRFIKHFEDSDHHSVYKQSFSTYSQLFPIPTRVEFVSDSTVAEITNVDKIGGKKESSENLLSEPEEGPIPSSSIFIEDEICSSSISSDTDDQMKTGEKEIGNFSADAGGDIKGPNSPFLTDGDDDPILVTNQNNPFLDRQSTNAELNSSLKTILTEAFENEITDYKRSHKNMHDNSCHPESSKSVIEEDNKMDCDSRRDMFTNEQDKVVTDYVMNPLQQNKKDLQQSLVRRTNNMFNKTSRIKFYEKRKFGKYNTSFVKTKKSVQLLNNFEKDDPYKLEPDSTSQTSPYTCKKPLKFLKGKALFQSKEIAEKNEAKMEKVINPTCPTCFKFLLNKDKMKLHMTICERRKEKREDSNL